MKENPQPSGKHPIAEGHAALYWDAIGADAASMHFLHTPLPEDLAAQARVTTSLAHEGWLDEYYKENPSAQEGQTQARAQTAGKFFGAASDFINHPRLKFLVAPTLALGIAACGTPSGATPSSNPDRSFTPKPASSDKIPGPRNESISTLFDAFFAKNNQKLVETEDPSNPNQCFDLVMAWVDTLGIPRDTIRHLNASDIYLNPAADTSQYFTRVENIQNAKPKEGDIIVWAPDFNGGNGHTGIATGKGTVEGKPTDNFEAFVQNYPLGSNSHLETYSFDKVLGWLTPKGFEVAATPTPNPESMLDQYFNVEGKTAGDQAATLGLKLWVQSMMPRNKTDAKDLGYEKISNTVILDSDLSAWLSDVSNILAQKDTFIPSVQTFSVNADVEDLVFSDTGDQATRIKAQFEVKGISIGAYPNGISTADAENGLQWTGKIWIKYLERERGNYYQIARVDAKTAKSFSDSTPSTLPAVFSIWREQTDFAIITLKKGVWDIKLNQPVGVNVVDAKDPAEFYPTPLYAFYVYCNPDSCSHVSK